MPYRSFYETLWRLIFFMFFCNIEYKMCFLSQAAPKMLFLNIFDRHLLAPWDFFRCTKHLPTWYLRGVFFSDLFLLSARKKYDLLTYYKRDIVTRWYEIFTPQKTVFRFSRCIIFASDYAWPFFVLRPSGDNRVKKYKSV